VTDARAPRPPRRLLAAKSTSPPELPARRDEPTALCCHRAEATPAPAITVEACALRPRSDTAAVDDLQERGSIFRRRLLRLAEQASDKARPARLVFVQPGRVKSTSPDASFHAEAVGRRALLEGYRRRGTPLRSRRERDLGHTRGRGPRDPVGTRRCKPGRDLGSTRAAECTVDACISPSSRLPAKPAVEGASGLRGRRRRHLPAAQLAS
jgi:hypothetical protein